MDDLICLISVKYQKDAIGQMIASECKRNVWASVRSVGRTEWVQAGQNGLNPELLVTTAKVNYQGEEIVEVAGKRYSVYRTYFNHDSDEIELYLEMKAGTRRESGQSSN